MQRYQFSLFNGEAVVARASEECAALREAGARALQMIAESIGSDERSWSLQEWRVDIADQAGLILITIGAYARDAAALKVTR
ncbi:DUF6894 family protein [Sphingomonas xinjiangensis]|uniref:DUF6894 domain-containing protein n=1 Tax=Sphingomonas xinjiangensis TaxID=643568 RepID=A0A840YGT3_9SPHN|nr:hypothetical protein [Sphingomonas xinjiangensis]MBB5712074.1 hypothetical protein [Sphingomonas xinjiangensis]